MNYNDFLCCVKGLVQTKMGKEVQIKLHQVMKNNGVKLDGLSMLVQSGNIAPTIYLNDFYKSHQEGMKVEDIVESICEIYEKSKIEVMVDTNFYSDFPKVRSRIMCKIINRKKNKELLEKIPYTPYLDLAIVYYCYVSDEAIGQGSILIYNNHMKLWGISEKELFYLARENTLRMFPVEFRSMGQMVDQILEEETDEEVAKLVKEEKIEQDEVPMYILTNKERNLGAATILYDFVLAEIANALEGDFYILPSSIHECIIVPCNIDTSRKELKEIVKEINATQLEKEEVLSDEVYLYSRKNHRLCL